MLSPRRNNSVGADDDSTRTPLVDGECACTYGCCWCCVVQYPAHSTQYIDRTHEVVADLLRRVADLLRDRSPEDGVGGVQRGGLRGRVVGVAGHGVPPADGCGLHRSRGCDQENIKAGCVVLRFGFIASRKGRAGNTVGKERLKGLNLGCDGRGELWPSGTRGLLECMLLAAGKQWTAVESILFQVGTRAGIFTCCATGDTGAPCLRRESAAAVCTTYIIRQFTYWSLQNDTTVELLETI